MKKLSTTTYYDLDNSGFSHIKITMISGIILLLIYYLINMYIVQNDIQAYSCLATAVVVAIDFLYMHFKKKALHYVAMSLSAFTSLCFLSLIMDLNGHTGRMWILLIPLMTFYTQDFKSGIIYLSIVSSLLLLKNIIYYNEISTDSRFMNNEQLIAFVLISLMTYLFKRSLRRKSSHINHQLYHDTLTNLPNRKALQEELLICKTEMLILINIDDFKSINNLYGTNSGDKVIQILGENLNRYISEFKHMSLFKLHADEFAIISSRMDDLYINIIREIPEYLLKVIKVNDIEIHTSVSIGISKGSSYLLKEADMALKHAKENRKDVVIYNNSMGLYTECQKNILIIEKLRDGILDNKIYPFFQPIINLENNKISKYECLVRLESDNIILAPSVFLDIAKKSKLYPKITRIMIEKTFEYFKDKEISFTVNLSFSDLVDGEITDFIYDQLIEYNIGQNVVFELLESENIDNSKEVTDFISKVKELGCRIAIDDFGSGYSNFSHLLKLKVDLIKIDGSLIKNIDVDKNSRIITKSIVSFAKELGIQTVAEHVDKASILKVIKEIGIDFGQGYLFGKPEPNII